MLYFSSASRRSGARPREVTPDVLIALVAHEGRTTLEADPGAPGAGRAELFRGRGSIEVERVRLPWEPRCPDQLRGPARRR
jgi:hypothetical protein